MTGNNYGKSAGLPGAILLVAMTTVLANVGCQGRFTSNAVIAEPETHRAAHQTVLADTIPLNPSRTEIAWKGTKMWGRGQHTGIVPLKRGYLSLEGDRLVGGEVVIDMTKIGITDIPPDQPEPIALLTKHLKDPLFFDAAKFPEASFHITDVERTPDGLIEVGGNLRIKDVVRRIVVPAERIEQGAAYTTRFRIDRFEWNVAYRGGFGLRRFSARNFVDRYIELEVTLAPMSNG